MQISKSAKVVPFIFAPALIISDILTIQMFELQKLDQGNRIQFSMPFDGKYQRLQT